MRKIKSTILMLIMAVLMIVPITNQATAQADEYATNVKVYVDGQSVGFDNNLGFPIIKDSRTFLPVRVTAEAMKAKVNWLPPSQIESKVGTRTVLMAIGSTNYQVNGETKQMEVEPFVNAAISRTYVPARFIAEGLGYVMDWRQVNGVDYVFNFTQGQTEAERKVIMDKIAPVAVVTPVNTSRTIGLNDSMFRYDGPMELSSIGLKTPIIRLISKDYSKYRWVCISHVGMNTFHTVTYPDKNPVTVDKSLFAVASFGISGDGYDVPVKPGMKLIYDVYDASDNLVRTVDFQL